MNERLTAALEYADRGLPVLPLAPDGKAPCGRLVRHGVKNATTDLSLVRGWWAAEPAANVGIACGDGLAVLDVDPRNGGRVTLDAYVDNLAAPLPRTAEVATGGGGSHLYFAAPEGLRSTILGSGLDLKAEGGYVVAPPSVHPSGRVYVWQADRSLAGDDLAPLPWWAARQATTPGASGRTAGTSADERATWAMRGASEGKRRRASAAISGHLLARGVDPYVVLGLMEAWRQVRCETGGHPFTDAELARLVDDLAARELAKRERKAAT